MPKKYIFFKPSPKKRAKDAKVHLIKIMKYRLKIHKLHLRNLSNFVV